MNLMHKIDRFVKATGPEDIETSSSLYLELTEVNTPKCSICMKPCLSLCPSVQGPLSANVPWHFLRGSPLQSVFFPIFTTLCADEEPEARGAKPLDSE